MKAESVLKREAGSVQLPTRPLNPSVSDMEEHYLSVTAPQGPEQFHKEHCCDPDLPPLAPVHCRQYGKSPLEPYRVQVELQCAMDTNPSLPNCDDMIEVLAKHFGVPKRFLTGSKETS